MYREGLVPGALDPEKIMSLCLLILVAPSFQKGIEMLYGTQ
jgi:hypothetical protein